MSSPTTTVGSLLPFSFFFDINDKNAKKKTIQEHIILNLRSITHLRIEQFQKNLNYLLENSSSFEGVRIQSEGVKGQINHITRLLRNLESKCNLGTP